MAHADDQVGRGDALVDALALYKTLLHEGVVHSLILRAAGREHNAWEIQWQSCVGRGLGGDQWVRVRIVQDELSVLGRFALTTLQSYAAHPAPH